MVRSLGGKGRRGSYKASVAKSGVGRRVHLSFRIGEREGKISRPTHEMKFLLVLKT